MAGKPQTKSPFRVPESNETVDNTITIRKSDLEQIDRYRDFIKRTTGYEPSYSDVFNQGAMFLMARDPAFRKHIEGSVGGRASKSSSSSKLIEG
jgi:hypothetical protein